MNEHRVAVVTGAGRGLGLACAKALAKDGLAVVLGDVDEEAARGGAEAIRATGGVALSLRTDVTEAAQARALIDFAVRQLGRLDCAVNNAGINLPTATMTDIDDEAWDRVFAVNVAGVRNCMRAELAHMLGVGRGAIVNMGSTLALVGGRQCAPYAASKHAIVGLTRSAALDHAASGIRINAVCPGPVHTQMASVHLRDDAAAFESTRAAMPTGRFVDAEEVAAAVVWLCSPASSGVYGHALTVDGGWTAA